MNGVVEAEMAVIGSCFAEADAIRVAAAELVPENFQDPRHAQLFKLMMGEYRDGRPVDQITIGQNFPDGMGGMKFIFDLTNLVPSALHVEHYARIVRAGWAERTLVAACREVANEPANEEARTRLRTAMSAHASVARRVRKIADVMTEYFETLDARIQGTSRVFTTRFPSLNKLLTGGGLAPGQLMMIGARTSRGKSALLLRMAADFARRGARVLFVSAEMTAIELVDRMISMESGLEIFKLTSRHVKDHLERVTATAAQVGRLTVDLSIGGRLTMERLLSDVDAASPDVVVVDYVQRFSPAQAGEVNRAAFFSDVANGLKGLAMTRGVAVMTASQLGRAVEFRDDKVPTLADLKESGGLEEAPDQVMFIHVPNDPAGGNRRIGEFILAKQRNGPLGKIPVAFNGDTTEFQELAEDEPKPF